MKNLFFIFVLFCLTVCTLKSQNASHKWGLGISPGVYSFYATESGANIFKPKVYGPGVELSIMRNLGKYFDLGVETNFARLVHPSDSGGSAAANSDNFSYRENFLSGHLGIRFRLDGGIIKPGSILVPFVKTGVGATSYGAYKNWSVYIPIGLGVHIHIPKSPVTFTLQSNYNQVFNMPENAKPAGFLHHSVGVSVSFGKKVTKEKIQILSDIDFDGISDSLDQCPNIFGYTATFGCPDKDGDNLKDSDDKCPDSWGFTNLNGCKDSDFDGIIDPDDKCPDQYAETENGCPGYTVDDTDSDGILNDVDLCPDVKGVFTASGCPDADGDGFRDETDGCPDVYGLTQYSGCPLPKSLYDSLKNKLTKLKENEDFAYKGYTSRPENKVEDLFKNLLHVDKEGNIIDGKGRLITNKGKFIIENGDIKDQDFKLVRIAQDGYFYSFDGTKIQSLLNLRNSTDINFNGVVDNGNLKGFTPPAPLSPEEEAYCKSLDLSSLRTAIYFEYGDAQASSKSTGNLKKIVDAMRKCAVLELQIAGHADSDGPDNYNLDLSEKRARTILKYLTGEGINELRLKYNAYGEKYPAAPNTTNEGKSQNRRAEIKIQKAN
jgi:OOP family OmpA-OmpF porin